MSMKSFRAAVQKASGEKFCINCKTHRSITLFNHHKQKCDFCHAKVQAAMKARQHPSTRCT